MSRSKRIIRSLADFTDIAEADLSLCLRAFTEWVRRQRAARADAMRAKVPFKPGDVFEWTPRERGLEDLAAGISATTDVHELGLRPSAVHACLELRIYALEDFSDLTASDLWRVPHIGRTTVLKVREMLQRVGLDFRESPNPVARALERAKSVRASQSTPSVSESSSIAELGLRTVTSRRLLEKGIATVGQLRAQTPKDLFLIFGRSGRQEVMRGLAWSGLTLACGPTDLELWQYGLREREDMRRPEDSGSVLELQPWLGKLATVLWNAGFSTVGQVRLAAAAGDLKARGLGEHGRRMIAAHFCD